MPWLRQWSVAESELVVELCVCVCVWRSESMDGSSQEFDDDLEFGCELGQSSDDAVMPYDDDQ